MHIFILVFPTTDVVGGEQVSIRGIHMKDFLHQLSLHRNLTATLQLVHFSSCYLGDGLKRFAVWPKETECMPNTSTYLSGIKGRLLGEWDSPNILMMINKFRYLWKDASDTRLVLNRISNEWHNLGQRKDQFVYIYVKGPKKWKRLRKKKKEQLWNKRWRF